MKKLLLTISIIVIIILIYIVGFKGLNIGNFKLGSIYDIKNSSNNLDRDLNKATEMTLKIYPESKDTLDAAITALKTTKDKYQTKISAMSDSTILEYTQIDNYEKEFLWTNIGNYAKNESVKLALDIAQSQNSENYILNFTVVGTYSNVADFIYDLENDDKLKFKIENFVMNPYSSTETTKITGPSGTTSNTDTPYEASKETTISEGTGTTTVKSNTPSNTVTDSQTTTETDATKTTTQADTLGSKTTTTTNSSSGGTSTMYSPDRVQATFVVKNVNINMN